MRIRHAYYNRMYKILQSHIKTIFRRVKCRANGFLLVSSPITMADQELSKFRQRYSAFVLTRLVWSCTILQPSGIRWNTKLNTPPISPEPGEDATVPAPAPHPAPGIALPHPRNSPAPWPPDPGIPAYSERAPTPSHAQSRRSGKGQLRRIPIAAHEACDVPVVPGALLFPNDLQDRRAIMFRRCASLLLASAS